MMRSLRSLRPILTASTACVLLAACATRAPESVPASTPVAMAPEPAPVHRSMALTPAEAIAAMELKPGYGLEVVLAEPQVEEPVMVAFDGNGTMYVAEMRTYMQDVDATGEMVPTSRVSRHEDTDGDGVYDRHTIFADGLLLPRTLLTLENEVVIGETNTLDLYVYEDTDGDGVADTKKPWFRGGPRGGNLEHQPNGLTWALDNGLYATFNDFRLRYTNGTVVRENIPVNGGQWGLTQDDWGKVWFVHAGAETGPEHFQQHIIYGQFRSPEEHIGDYKIVWPIDNIPDTQGGPGQLRPDNTLNHFTATCGQDIFRGDRLPVDLRGDLLFAEPVGRLIRRTEITSDDGIVKLANPYEAAHGEFMRTRDPLFRPVNMVTAPDGTLYVVDMYRGIIQEGNWTREGTYLREQIVKHGLDREIGRGRIYRVRHDDFTPGPQPRMLEETSAQLVAHFSHPNGWWRDTAQKLLILRGDHAVVPALTDLAAGRTTTNPLARSHALWTLEGLDALTPELVQGALASDHPGLRRMGLRLAEGWLLPAEGGNTAPLPVDEEARSAPAVIADADRTPATVIRPAAGIGAADVASLRAGMQAALQDSDPEVVVQAMVSLNRVGGDDVESLIQSAAEASTSAGVYSINEQLWQKGADEDPFLMVQLGAAGLKSYREGKKIYDSLCFSCHGPDGLGVAVNEERKLAPPLTDSARVLGSEGAIIDIVLHGLQGDVDGVDYGAPMIPMNSYSDAELASVLTYIRNSFGNRGSVVEADTVATHRKRGAARTAFWTMAELEQSYPVLTVPRERFVKRDQWKLTNGEPLQEGSQLTHAIDDSLETGFATAKVAPFPGQWLVIELPAKSTITSIVMDATGDEESYAPGYDVQISTDGQSWGEPVVKAIGEVKARLHLAKPIEAKWLRLTVNHKDGWQRWVINNLELYGDEG
ncbi:DUF7133 domain-containing protein [Synoicihabitans lomoniglobus]|uniref:Discoidin domain-containing protein n=1 Tax=Synoicihabitans lomoniglobus TaxID=2909285 RepID=A0AAF0CNV1_9BACT|nr:discoidin domain-containing protein [Opitutaceae bacterium LMO-M01]WED65091.1 discoidin domain-containing protein [Opitutaceae bacterium LMO-M01]